MQGALDDRFDDIVDLADGQMADLLAERLKLVLFFGEFGFQLSPLLQEAVECVAGSATVLVLDELQIGIDDRPHDRCRCLGVF